LLLANAGNLVKDNDTILAVINQLRPAYVDFSVPEHNLPAIREKMAGDPLTVEVRVASQPGRSAQGELKLINNQVDITTGTVLLRAECPNEDEWLWPGQFVDVSLTLAVEKNSVVVPAEAIQFSQQGRYVIVVQPDQTVSFEPVEVGDALGKEVVVKKGLQAGQRLVTSGQLRLQPHSRVEVKRES
jgi:multidrug efflux system membrane fusion protein